VTTAILLNKVESTLGPSGFERSELTWTRPSDPLIDVVDIQFSNFGDEVTINCGVVDIEVFERCWGNAPPIPPDETACTVRARVGQLIADDRDVWWPTDDVQMPNQLADALSEAVLPFVESMHSRDEMVRWLRAREVVRQKYPPPIIYLAILVDLEGDPVGACSLLNELQGNALGAWKQRVREVSARLGCE
jgi:hypothetical protein